MEDTNLLHINDVIFKDSIQSAISPNTDIASPPTHESPIDDAISLNTNPSTKEVSTALDNDKASVVKTSPTLKDLSFDDDTQTDSSVQFIQKSNSEAPSKEVDQNHVEFLKEIEEIPNRMVFKISEVADLTGVKPYILRYWESEFEQLRPKKAINNRRMYTQKNVTTVLLIKKLLYKDKYSIEGAKKALKQLQAEVRKDHKAFIQSCQQQKAIEQLKDIICNISSLKKSLSTSIEDQS